MVTLKFLFGLVILNLRACSALQVTPGSSCSAVCLNDTEADPLDPESSSTDVSEITCHDDEYETERTGLKYRNCLDCLRKSNATHEAESDAQWFLYNLRYSVDVCIYGFPNASKRVSTPCDIETSCGPLKKAMEAGSLDPDRDAYEYCSADGADRFTDRSLNPCISCLAASTDLSFMANFMTALQAGCEQRPEGGKMLGLSGTVFTTERVEITDPPADEPPPEDKDSATMTQGTVVGIAVGASLLFLGGVGLFWVYHRRQKRLYGEPVQSDYDPRRGAASSKALTPSPPPPHLGGGGVLSSATYPYDPQKTMMAQVGEYELRSQQQRQMRPHSHYANAADYQEALEKEMAGLQSQSQGQGYQMTPRRIPDDAAAVTTTFISNTTNHNNHYAQNPHLPGAGAQSALLPTHSAYREPERSSHSHSHGARGPSPPQPARTADHADSYAMQRYLSAAETASSQQVPGPPLPPPASHTRGRTDSGAAAVAQQGQQVQRVAPPPPPPPPPPRTPKAPVLSLPSVPRIRVPKKYVPPRISVEGPTPVDGEGDSDNDGRRWRR